MYLLTYVLAYLCTYLLMYLLTDVLPTRDGRMKSFRVRVLRLLAGFLSAGLAVWLAGSLGWLSVCLSVCLSVWLYGCMAGWMSEGETPWEWTGPHPRFDEGARAHPGLPDIAMQPRTHRVLDSYRQENHIACMHVVYSYARKPGRVTTVTDRRGCGEAEVARAWRGGTQGARRWKVGSMTRDKYDM